MATAKKLGRLVIDDLSAGRNGVDPPQTIKNNECADAVNVDWFRAKFARKRGGCTPISMSFSAGGPFLSTIGAIFRHVPGTSETSAEMWAVSTTLLVGRMAGAATFTAPTLKDAGTGNAFGFDGASINGHFMLAYESAVFRHHVWDTATVRRTGMAQAGGTAVADTGGGAYASVLRYYRMRWTTQVAGITIRRGEAIATATAFTPSGAGAAARLTQATPPNEGETHWEVEASLDNATFYRIATVVVGTTTYDDSAATSTYNTNPLSALTGTYTLQKPYRFIAVDQNRQLGFGSFNPADKQSRIEYSAVIGSLDVSDEERVDTNTNYYSDLDESDSGNATGFDGPILGSFIAFKFSEIAQLTPTGQTSQPYSVKFISKSIGAICNRSIVRGEDRDGNPCLYWMSHRGPYRWGANGLEYIGRGVEDVILGPTATMLTTIQSDAVAHTLYFQDKRQVWFWYLNDATNRLCLMYDVMSGGWARITGTTIAAQLCSCMFANTLGASMSLDLKPYTGNGLIAPGILKWDTGTADDNAGTPIGIQATITTKAFEPGGPGFYGECGDAILTAAAATGVTITDFVIPDFGASTTKSGTALLTATGAESRVVRRFEDSTLGGAQFYQHTIGDAAATQLGWTLDRVVVPISREEQASS